GRGKGVPRDKLTPDLERPYGWPRRKAKGGGELLFDQRNHGGAVPVGSQDNVAALNVGGDVGETGAGQQVTQGFHPDDLVAAYVDAAEEDDIDVRFQRPLLRPGPG